MERPESREEPSDDGSPFTDAQPRCTVRRSGTLPAGEGEAGELGSAEKVTRGSSLKNRRLHSECHLLISNTFWRSIYTQRCPETKQTNAKNVTLNGLISSR